MRCLLLLLLSLGGCSLWAQPSYLASDGTFLWDDCGGQDERACMPGDAAYVYLRGFAPLPVCDFSLNPNFENGSWMCRDLGRRKTVSEQVWGNVRFPLSRATHFQQTDQHRRISADLPLNYVPILGTHNSYSNPVDGGNLQLVVDQMLTITDQLQMGARHIRLDPIAKVSSATPILCHASNYDESWLSYFKLPTNERELCATETNVLGTHGFISRQRPLVYGIREVKYWLQKHPDEVIVLRFNNVGDSVRRSDVVRVIEHELGDMVYREPANGKLPTMRQMRALGKQVVVLGNVDYYSNYVYKDPTPYPGNDTTSPLFPICKYGNFESTGLDRPATRNGVANWVNIGEDRSLSNAFNPPGQNGLVGALETETATYCGYSMIGLDFFHSLPSAPDVFLPGLGQKDYSGPSPDPRPHASIWSWTGGTVLTEPMPAVLSKPFIAFPHYPGYLSDHRNYRWKPMDENAARPFACAGAAEADNPRKYEWRITPTAGPWKMGETECQKLGAQFHFWRPNSAIENQGLVAQLKGVAASDVWINHYSGRTMALPESLQFDFAYTPGATAPTRTLVMTSGLGGKFTMSFSTTGNGPNFTNVPSLDDTVRLAPVFRGDPFLPVGLDLAKIANLPAGTYTGMIRIQEIFGQESNAVDVPVTLRLTRPNGVLSGTPSPVTFVSGLTQTVSITSSTVSAEVLPPTGLPAWLQVSMNRNTTPLVLTLTANPALAKGRVEATLSFTSTTNGIGGFTLPVQLETAPVMLETQPAGVPLSVDGASVSTPFSTFWVVGSTHSVTGTPTWDNNGSRYSFTGWADGVVANPRQIVAAAGGSRLTAQFQVSHLLTLLPASNGKVVTTARGVDGYFAQGMSVGLSAVADTGFEFQRFTGDLTSGVAEASILMDRPKSVGAVFVSPVEKTTITSSPLGQEVVVDGVKYVTPVAFSWNAGETHTLMATTRETAAGERMAFLSWVDRITESTRTVTASGKAQTFSANFRLEYLMSTVVVPSGAGAVSGGGWYPKDSEVTLNATANSGFVFERYSGVASQSSTLTLRMWTPLTATANFNAAAPPKLVATAQGRTDLGGGVVRVPIVISNLGTGPAGDTLITAIDGISVPLGSGDVKPLLPVGGVSAGTLGAGQKTTVNVDFAWPTSATRVTFTVRYTANRGSYSGSNSITLFR